MRIFDLANLTANEGFRIDGAAASDWSGFSVSNAGDVNGDGLEDVLIGAAAASPYSRAGAGSSYVIYGNKGGYAAPIDLVTLNNTIGFRIDGATVLEDSGCSVSNAGDVNGDGLEDVIIGAPYVSPYSRTDAGSSYIIYGKKGGYAAPIDLATLNNTIGFRIDGAAASDWSGYSVNTAGDINGDGLEDMLIGAAGASPYSRNSAGSSYVIYGKKGGYAAPIDLATLNNTIGFRIDGATAYDQSGTSVSVGDVNGDGIGDMVIYSSSSNSLSWNTSVFSYVIYGKLGGYPLPIDLATFNRTSSLGFRIETATADPTHWGGGNSVGDFNGDGIDDVILGATNAIDGDGAGASYVVYGKKGGYSLPFDLAMLNTTTGFRIDGAVTGDKSGGSVSGVGDVNGDGVADIIIGAYGASPYGRSSAGSSYVIYGSYIPCELINNTLTLRYQNAMVPPALTLTTANLNAIDHFYYSNDSQIQFKVSNIIAGNFELISSRQTVTSFTQQQIKAGDIQFVQDGSPNLPAYEASVSNIKAATTSPKPATVTFIAPPFVIGNIINVPAAVDTIYQNTINITQIFKDSNYPLYFTAVKANGNPLPDWVQFSVQYNATVTFESTAPLTPSLIGTTTTLSLIATNSYNLSNHADFNVTVPKPDNTKNITPLVAGSSIGGVVGLAALAGSAFGFWRYRKAQHFAEERKNYTFANLLREQLQLSGIDDFQSNAGLAFVNAIEVLSNELQLQDIDVRNMYPNELDTLSVYVANAIKTIVKISTTYFGIYKTINPDDIQNNAGTIAKVAKELCQAPINESNYGTFNKTFSE